MATNTGNTETNSWQFCIHHGWLWKLTNVKHATKTGRRKSARRCCSVQCENKRTASTEDEARTAKAVTQQERIRVKTSNVPTDTKAKQRQRSTSWKVEESTAKRFIV